MKIGVLAAGYNCAEYFNEVLKPWIQYKEKHGDLIISVISAPFENYEIERLDKSVDWMIVAKRDEKIDYLHVERTLMNESSARNIALYPLLDEKCDIIWILDFDEVYTLEQIEKIVQFVENNPLTTWFKIRFKNYVIDKNHYVDDFFPPRIFRTENLGEFVWDNDLAYLNSKDPSSLVRIDYRNFSNLTLPKNIAFVNHYSWCGTPERLKAKIDYQLKHFDGICSYKWDEEKDQIVLNLDFYKKHNIPVPIIYAD